MYTIVMRQREKRGHSFIISLTFVWPREKKNKKEKERKSNEINSRFYFVCRCYYYIYGR
jgi:hypothetical protein